MGIVLTFTPQAITLIYCHVLDCKPESDLLTTVPFSFLSKVVNQL